MNAATLYAQLSREVLLLTEETDLSDFMRNDKGFYKLRNLLLCRSCRELCVEPYSSEFCQHLTCKNCFDSKQSRNAGCKWCRIDENLSFDINSQILVGLYKNLCAILCQFLSGAGNTTGLSPEKAKLLRFLQEGCITPTIFIGSSKIEDQTINSKEKSNVINSKEPSSNVESIKCPPCCCSCIKDRNPTSSETDFSNDPIKINVAESSCNSVSKNLPNQSQEHPNDNVSSTVPDSAPAKKDLAPVRKKQNKYGGIQDGESPITAENVNNIDELGNLANTAPENDTVPPKISTGEFYKNISSISLKGRKNRNIFEKFGLELSSPSEATDTPLSNSEVTSQRKVRKKKIKETAYASSVPEPKLKPLTLKLKVRKVTNDDSTSSYKVQYSDDELPEEINQVSSPDDDDDVLYISEPVKNDSQNSDNGTIFSDSGQSEIQPPVVRKVKRKATFISNYSIFSSDSDFEQDVFKPSRTKQPKKRVKERDVCGCGAGSHVKYFTDICKRSRCPCYSQGKACVNCRCRFCSNPFLLDDEVEEESCSSDSSEDEPLINIVRDDDNVDVEA